MSEAMERQRRARFFRFGGYLRVLSVLQPEETTELHDFVVRQRALNEEAAKATDHSAPSTKIYGLYDRNPELMNRLVCHPRLIDAVTALLGPNVVFVKNRHNHASVNSRDDTQKEARLHRDILQPTRGLLTACVYLEDSSIENGCTHIVPGSQDFDYVDVPQADGGGTWMDEHLEFSGLMDQALPVPMPAGSALLFDSLAFHGVSQNRTDGTRTSITLGYRSVDELAFQPNQSREVLTSGEYIYRGNDR